MVQFSFITYGLQNGQRGGYFIFALFIIILGTFIPVESSSSSFIVITLVLNFDFI